MSGRPPRRHHEPGADGDAAVAVHDVAAAVSGAQLTDAHQHQLDVLGGEASLALELAADA